VDIGSRADAVETAKTACSSRYAQGKQLDDIKITNCEAGTAQFILNIVVRLRVVDIH
jgi:hypothetical protein